MRRIMNCIGYYINKYKIKPKMTKQKEEALARLDAIELEQKKLRAIIEAPEKREKPTTLKEACVNQKVDYGDFIAECAKLPKNQSGLKKLTLINRDIRGDWKPTLENNWYFPWMKRKKSGFSFDFVGFDGDVSYYDVVPASLVVGNSEQAEYSGKTFEAEWAEYLSPE